MPYFTIKKLIKYGIKQLLMTLAKDLKKGDKIKEKRRFSTEEIINLSHELWLKK